MTATFGYILKLLVLIPLVAGLAYGSLWLWRRAQQGMAGAARRERLVQLVDAIPLGATGKLAVVEFEGKRLLLSVSRTGVQLISEAGVPAAPAATGRFGD